MFKPVGPPVVVLNLDLPFALLAALLLPLVAVTFLVVTAAIGAGGLGGGGGGGLGGGGGAGRDPPPIHISTVDSNPNILRSSYFYFILTVT
jgi:hypothetical protein